MAACPQMSPVQSEVCDEDLLLHVKIEFDSEYGQTTSEDTKDDTHHQNPVRTCAALVVSVGDPIHLIRDIMRKKRGRKPKAKKAVEVKDENLGMMERSLEDD